MIFVEYKVSIVKYVFKDLPIHYLEKCQSALKVMHIGEMILLVLSRLCTSAARSDVFTYDMTITFL